MQPPAPAQGSFKIRPQRKRRTCEHGKFQPYCKDCKGNMLCEHLRHKNRCAFCKRSRAANGITVFIATTTFRCDVRAAIARFYVYFHFTLNTDACRRCYEGGSETPMGHYHNCFAHDQWPAVALLSRGAEETAAAALLPRSADETAAAAPDETAAAALLSRGAHETANGSAPTRARRINTS